MRRSDGPVRAAVSVDPLLCPRKVFVNDTGAEHPSARRCEILSPPSWQPSGSKFQKGAWSRLSPSKKISRVPSRLVRLGIFSAGDHVPNTTTEPPLEQS